MNAKKIFTPVTTIVNNILHVKLPVVDNAY